MAMVKIIDPSGWNFDRPVAQMVKVSSDGLRGQDRDDFIKTASPVFLDLIDNIKIAEDEIPVHVISHGSSEFYGPNRNGDGFKEATCREHCHTFEKYAKWYRNHKNKDPKKSYGGVKKAAYNDDMHRVEILAILNGSQKAAERNGGFVADREIDRISRGEDIPVSMACRVPYDVCSGCGNKARTRDDYCTEENCEYGGCKHNITKVAENGHVLHVDNPSPAWFDISDVFRPADRIAYGGKADYLLKAASHDFTPGAMMADMLGVTAPLDVILGSDAGHYDSPVIEGQVKLAYGLARLESISDTDANVKMAFDESVQPRLSKEQLDQLGRPGSMQASAGLAKLAELKIFLTLDDFARWVGKEAEAEAANQALPWAYNDLVNAGDLDRRLSANPYACSHKAASAGQKSLAGNIEGTHSVNLDAVQARAMRASLRNITPAVKTAADRSVSGHVSPEAQQLVRAYGLYKLAALHHVAGLDSNFNLTVRLALAQNGV